MAVESSSKAQNFRLEDLCQWSSNYTKSKPQRNSLLKFLPLCDKAIEITAYALLHCDHAKMTWAFWHNCPVDLSSPSCDLVDIAFNFIAKGSPNDLELFIVVAWSIWWNRNQAIHEDSGTPPIHAWEMAGSVLAEFKAACSFPVLP